jgi:hypothetical protein
LFSAETANRESDWREFGAWPKPARYSIRSPDREAAKGQIRGDFVGLEVVLPDFRPPPLPSAIP